MDLNKSRDFFDPNKVEDTCHIIGCGSIGSNVAELLTRYGIKKLTLWDFDLVESHNIVNQLFTTEDIDKPKTEALSDILTKINPEITITVRNKGWKNERLYGHVFLCVDSIEVRKEIVEANLLNESIKTMFDFRTTLEEGQCYFADWTINEQRENLLATMNFTHKEAQAESPVSACGFELSVSPVVKATALYGICNFTNYINNKETKQLILTRPYDFLLLSA